MSEEHQERDRYVMPTDGPIVAAIARLFAPLADYAVKINVEKTIQGGIGNLSNALGQFANIVRMAPEVLRRARENKP